MVGIPLLENQVISALRRITRAIDLHSRLLLAKHGLTAPQLAAMQVIGRRQPVTVGTLAREIHLSQATVTGILTRLEQRGFLTRTRDRRDRRIVMAALDRQRHGDRRVRPVALAGPFSPGVRQPGSVGADYDSGNAPTYRRHDGARLRRARSVRTGRVHAARGRSWSTRRPQAAGV